MKYITKTIAVILLILTGMVIGKLHWQYKTYPELKQLREYKQINQQFLDSVVYEYVDIPQELDSIDKLCENF